MHGFKWMVHNFCRGRGSEFGEKSEHVPRHLHLL